MTHFETRFGEELVPLDDTLFVDQDNRLVRPDQLAPNRMYTRITRETLTHVLDTRHTPHTTFGVDVASRTIYVMGETRSVNPHDGSNDERMVRHPSVILPAANTNRAWQDFKTPQKES